MARHWKVLLVTSVAVMMALLDVTIVNIAFSDLHRTFPDRSLGDLSWVLNAYSIVFAAALVPLGRVADRIGLRAVFLAGVVTFVGASLACGLAQSLSVLIAARVVQALGAAAVIPTSLGLVLPEFPPHRRATAIGVWTSAGVVAGAAGPALGGAIVDWNGWRWVFFVNLAIGVPGLVAAARVLRERRDENATGWPDMLGAALLAPAVAAVTLAIVKGPEWGFGSAPTILSTVAGVVLFATFVLRSASHPSPVVDAALLRIRSFSVSSFVSLVFAAGVSALLLCNVLFLTGVWGYDALEAGGALTTGPIAAALCGPVAGRLADRFSPRAVAIAGALFFAGGALFFSRAPADANFWIDFFPGTLLIGAGVSFGFTGFGGAAFSRFPRTRFATGVALTMCLRQIGTILGVAALIGLLGVAGAGDLDRYHAAYLSMAALGGITAAGAVAIGRTRGHAVPATPARDGGPQPAEQPT